MEQYMLPCLHKMIFGIDCPGCGLQRAVWLLCRGNFEAAWQMYPPVFTTLLLAVSGVLFLVFRRKWQGTLLLFSALLNVVFVAVAYYYKVITNLNL